MGAAAAAPAAEASCGVMCAASAAGVGWSMVAVEPSDKPSSPSRELDSSISVNESMPSSMKVKWGSIDPPRISSEARTTTLSAELPPAATGAAPSWGAMCAASAAGVGWSMVAVEPSESPSSPSKEFDSSISVRESMPSSMKVKWGSTVPPRISSEARTTMSSAELPPAAAGAAPSWGAMCAASAAGVGWSMVAVEPSESPSSPSNEFDSSISVNESMPSSMKVKWGSIVPPRISSDAFTTISSAFVVSGAGTAAAAVTLAAAGRGAGESMASAERSHSGVSSSDAKDANEVVDAATGSAAGEGADGALVTSERYGAKLAGAHFR